VAFPHSENGAAGLSIVRAFLHATRLLHADMLFFTWCLKQLCCWLLETNLWPHARVWVSCVHGRLAHWHACESLACAGPRQVAASLVVLIPSVLLCVDSGQLLADSLAKQSVIVCFSNMHFSSGSHT
jgi:hypothetical protein